MADDSGGHIAIVFRHPQVKNNAPLTINIAPEEIGWGYSLNTANFNTYGGEVIQILSVFIEDLKIAGSVRTYPEMEQIYRYFAEYMVLATQGSDGHGSYNQHPMTFSYPHRQWEFKIQPLRAPGFIYSLETITPKWRLDAHIVDETPDVHSLAQLVVTDTLNNAEGSGDFTLTGFISPDHPDPSKNPFSAPGTLKGNVFTPLTGDETTSEIGKVGDYYSKLLPAYTGYTPNEGGASPAFGKTSAPTGEETSTGKSTPAPESSQPGHNPTATTPKEFHEFQLRSPKSAGELGTPAQRKKLEEEFEKEGTKSQPKGRSHRRQGI